MADINEIFERFVKVTAELTDGIKQVNTDMFNQLQDQIAELKADKTKLKGECDELRDKYKYAHDWATKYKAQIEEKNKQLVEKDNEIAELKSENEKNRATIQRYTDVVEQKIPGFFGPGGHNQEKATRVKEEHKEERKQAIIGQARFQHDNNIGVKHYNNGKVAFDMHMLVGGIREYYKLDVKPTTIREVLYEVYGCAGEQYRNCRSVGFYNNPPQS